MGYFQSLNKAVRVIKRYETISNNSICKVTTDSAVEPKDEYHSIVTAFWQNIVGCIFLALLFWQYLRLVRNSQRVKCEKKAMTTEQWNFCSKMKKIAMVRPCLNLEWFLNAYVRDEEAKLRLGEDSILYLSFQRYIVVILLVYCICSLIILCPINITFGKSGDIREFKTLSLYNIDPEESYIWVPVMLGFFYMPLTMIMMKKYAKDVLGKFRCSTASQRSLVLDGLPMQLRSREGIREWFGEKYPWVEVRSVFLTFPMKKLYRYHERKDMLEKILKECKDDDKLFLLLPPSCIRLKEGGLARTHYQGKLEATMELIRHEGIVCLAKPLDTAFVVLENQKDARDIVRFEMIAGIKEKDFKVSHAPTKQGKYEETITMASGVT